MTGDTLNPFGALVQELSDGQCNRSKVAIKKVYINEDPSKEEMVPCPHCLRRNLHHMVRYLYVNLHEAIYKCEAPDCMYPFRSFKFKNYSDNTVYQYEQRSSQTALEHAFGQEYSNCYTKQCSSYEPSIEHIASVDFDLDFLSSMNVQQNSSVLPAEQISSGPLQQLIDCDSLSKTFDTGFIDDIINDLLLSSSSAPTARSTTIPATSATSKIESDIKVAQGSKNAQPAVGGRRLEKCLKEFKTTSTNHHEQVFKKPELLMSKEEQPYRVENLSPTRLRIKKIPAHKPKGQSKKSHHHEHSKPHHSRTNDIQDAHVLVKNKALKPLDFLMTLNTLSSQKAVSVKAPTPKPKKSSNPANVQRMLSFIKRSMKNREQTDNISPGRCSSPSPECEMERKDYRITNAESGSTHNLCIAQSPSVPTVQPCTTSFTEVNSIIGVDAVTPGGGMDLIF